jgi:hypothetical protein
MKYMMIHSLDESEESVEPEAGTCSAPEALEAWIEEMTARGVVLDGARLHPTADATTVRAVDGRVQVTDGPFAETKEQVAGYDVIECPDLDAAIAVAAAHPTTRVGSIEVRAFDEGMPDPEVPEHPVTGKRRYLMLVCATMREALQGDDPGPAADDPDGTRAQAPSQVDAWIDRVSDRRIYGWPLVSPDRAVTVRRVDGEVVTTDGPFAETKEQIAGFDLLECHDLDEALDAAGTHPVARFGAIEIRPLWL